MGARTDGGTDVTASETDGTSGGAAGASGNGSRRLTRLLFIPVVVYSFIQAGVNIVSRLEDDRRYGGDLGWQFSALYELSSLAAWLILLRVIWWATGTLRPPRFTWPVALALHAAMTLPVSLAHVAMMFAVRYAVLALWGLSYEPGPLGEAFLYEFRKDAATYVLVALALSMIRWVVARHEAAEAGPPRLPSSPTLTLNDGAVQMLVPTEEIDLLEAAGNYVEVHWGKRRILHRATLASMQDRLTDAGFVRIHRSLIVRRAAIRQVETLQSGDFLITLADGTEKRGSRRYRSALS